MKSRVPLQRNALLDGVFNNYEGPNFSIRLWDNWQWVHRPSSPTAFTLVLNSPQVLRSLLANADEITLGEAFIQRTLEIEGDLFAAFEMAEYLLTRPRSLWSRAVELLLRSSFSLAQSVKHGRAHSRHRDRLSIASHYDQPVEFFRPWLGPTLAYSCAYFRSPHDSLDRAQTQKLELICRKLNLQPHDRFLDLGCGWGSLILHAAAAHHAQSHGITLSRNQHETCTHRIRAARLEDRCMAELRDYRDCAPLYGSFDKISSVGMYEHVGLPNLPLYFRTAKSLLKPGGTFLNHGIARSASSPARRSSFIDRYVFPDGRLVTLTQAVQCAEEAGLEVRDVENLREHYDLTLRRWVEGLEQHAAELLTCVSDETCRIWLLYMAGCSAAFRRGDIAVYQLLLARPDRRRSSPPMLRGYWYTQDFATNAESNIEAAV